MTIPKTLVICDAVWQVEVVKRIGRGGLLGLCCPVSRRIHILGGLPPGEAWEVLIHEVLHAIEFGVGLELGHKVINRLERPLASVLGQCLGLDRTRAVKSAGARKTRRRAV